MEYPSHPLYPGQLPESFHQQKRQQGNSAGWKDPYTAWIKINSRRNLP